MAAGYEGDTKVINALVRNTSQAFLTTGDIEIIFILDDRERLKEHRLKEMFTSF